MSVAESYNFSEVVELLESIATKLGDSKTTIRNLGGTASNAGGLATLTSEILSLRDDPSPITNVLSVMGQQPKENGDVDTLTAELLGAALAACNWQSYTTKYNTWETKQITALDSALEEGKIDQDYYDQYMATRVNPEYRLGNLSQGCRFVRVDPIAEGGEAILTPESVITNPEKAGMHFGMTVKVGGTYQPYRPEVEAKEAVGQEGDPDYEPAVEYQAEQPLIDTRKWLIAYLFLPFDKNTQRKGYIKYGPFDTFIEVENWATELTIDEDYIDYYIDYQGEKTLVTNENFDSLGIEPGITVAYTFIWVDPENHAKGHQTYYTKVFELNGLVDTLALYLNNSQLASQDWIDEQFNTRSIWIDKTEEFLNSTYYDENVDFYICGSQDVRDFLWSLNSGCYKMNLDDGVIYMTALAEPDDSVRYRWVQVFTDNTNENQSASTFKNFEVTLYDNNTSLLTVNREQNGQPYISLNGKRLASLDEVITEQDVRNIIFNEFEVELNEAFVSTMLSKTRNDVIPGSSEQIKVNIKNNQWLYNQIANKSIDIEDCKLVFMMCSRSRGRRFNWWHPDNYDAINEINNKPSTNRLGYGALAGKKTCRTYFDKDERVDEIFPNVPSWMSNDGYMETIMDLTEDDIIRGYVFIDPKTYFLPMIKPCNPKDLPLIDGEPTEDWGKNSVFISTTSKRAAMYARPIVCSFAISINGKIGRFENYIKVGPKHNHADSKLQVIQAIENRSARITGLYLSII